MTIRSPARDRVLIARHFSQRRMSSVCCILPRIDGRARCCLVAVRIMERLHRSRALGLLMDVHSFSPYSFSRN